MAASSQYTAPLRVEIDLVSSTEMSTTRYALDPSVSRRMSGDWNRRAHFRRPLLRRSGPQKPVEAGFFQRSRGVGPRPGEGTGSDIEYHGSRRPPRAGVFQHIPSREVVLNYLRETRRVLRTGGGGSCVKPVHRATKDNGLPRRWSSGRPCRRNPPEGASGVWRIESRA